MQKLEEFLPFVNRLKNFIFELAEIAVVVVLLQLFITWVGFEAAWPILVAFLFLTVIIASLRK